MSADKFRSGHQEVKRHAARRGAVAQASFAEAESAWGRAWTYPFAGRSRYGFGRSSFPPRLASPAEEETQGSVANDNQFKTRTAFIATRGVREYRATIPHLLGPEDHVLEVGCEWGTTTALLAQRARTVLGTDISRDNLARARAMHPEVEFQTLDAFDLRSILDLGRPFTAVYMDLSGLSGYRGLLDLVALLNAYATVLAPRLIVVKSGALKHFATQCRAWSGED